MQTRPIKQQQEVLKSATLREFSGGLNLLDDDLNLSTKFSKRMTNCYYSPDQTVKVRFGIRLFNDLSKFTSSPNVSVINTEYFSYAIICVMSNGEILRVLANGSVARIWDNTIAKALPGAPNGWSNTDFASFEQFNGQLIVCNGVNKPLIISNTLSVDYLKDLASNTNINTPIAKYVTSCNGYLIMAGDPVKPNRLHISARYTSGTFYGDPAPNDATYIDVGTSLRNASIIKGIRAFRDRLIVAYPEGSVIGTLGIYNSTGNVHQPSFQDTVELYGAISHRSMLSYGDDMLFMDTIGVPSLKRTVFSGTIRPERVSDLVDPEMSKAINKLTGLSQENRTFSIFNQKEGMFMFFIPDNDDLANTTETVAYCFLFRPTLNVSAWCKFQGWNFTCACRTQEGNIFFGDKNGKLWLYGSDTTPIYSDYMNDDSINNKEGIPITFDWELPWSDINQRTKIKHTKYITLDTRGTGRFNLSMYCDRFVKNGSGEDSPQLKMSMVGGDVVGFGGPTHPYGGGRPTANERKYAWPAKFQIMKLRFRGSTTTQLQFISISFLYQEGGYNR
ncbi:MAG: hypothetical protein IM561_08945 [Microcystis sp. M60BS1]|uniref:hypothetical protein n=1 Tax=unclassified Microcystis TaxID=2643300 RepID=UPI00257B16DB|nr:MULTISPECIES: hypothetical protein [unclassified Microcystis]MCA2594382.1 hypothetical protein [Microcystis sp. M38BS1]MCA6581494.1 hypothetical protein [Pseudanabaena sp. M34BS1SP1A06MG]MCA2510495.1 hypothetical protein [Microcystis sp. M60BS1]MCA2555781.1 hypothetical protein [Microcystis sp. M43BS1]MCA2589490.1 hypothetical protein [Microcystis sp. M31BS1]